VPLFVFDFVFSRTYNVLAMENELRPSTAEKELLTLAYNRFYGLFEEVMSDSFWEKEDYYRFSRIKDIFSIYAEVLNYPPIRWVIDYLKKKRPPMEAEIGGEFFAFIRNVMAHFPFFQRWEDVWVNKTIVNWHREGQSIDKFLTKYQGHEPVKYRFWEADKKKMSYMSVNFPAVYTSESKIFLKDIISEKDGVKFSVILMRKILDTQVESS
jgi:hypothetical protein